MAYVIENMTVQEYIYLLWAADRGYDAEFLKLAELSDYQLAYSDGTVWVDDPTLRLIKYDGKYPRVVVFDDMPENVAWEFKENVEQDRHAFLACCGLPDLRERMEKLLDRII